MVPTELSADPVAVLERHIQAGQSGQAEARIALRRFLFAEAGHAEPDGSIGDALAILARNPVKSALAATVLLRCLAVPGLVPGANEINHITRSTVDLCEGAVPELLSYFKYDSKKQNYIKFAVLVNIHNRVLEILEPLRSSYGDLEALLSARKDIIGLLNHSIIRMYCAPFRLKEVRSTVEMLLGKIKKVSAFDATLLLDIDDCNRSIDTAKGDFSGAETFLTEQYLSPFLLACRSALAEFLRTQRARFSTDIVWGHSSRELQKRYPLNEPGREMQVVVPLRNVGPGSATDVRVTVTSGSDDVVIGGATVMLGNVLPGELSVAIDLMTVAPTPRFSALLEVEWGQIGSAERSSKLFDFAVVAQAASVDWTALEYVTPYSTAVAEGYHFVGRDEKVRTLGARLMRAPMESFYITGQKRVGKTSLALACARHASLSSAPGTLHYQYILWGEIAHADPGEAMHQLGQQIEEFIGREIPAPARPDRGDYHGSLAGLVRLASIARSVCAEKRFAIIVDEFDEIHQELYLQGNLAETFFSNLRALSRATNICVILVGGENMPFVMGRQGQKLNNFYRENLNYYSRSREWSDFELLVRAPSSKNLNWHDDAVSEVFNITRGNPYFANIVCGAVFRSAVAERDADITATEVRRATETAISGLGANSFAHLWQDGIPKPMNEREPDILRRSRVLVATARCLQHGLPTTAENIADNRGPVNLSDVEIPAILADFQRREVLHEGGGVYTFELPIFERWLVDAGASQLIADVLSEELANSAIAEENAAVVRSEEVVSLARNWPTYRGKHVGTDDIRAWYQQVHDPREQRLLFELLKRTRVYSEAHVRERLKAAHAFLRPQLPEFIIRKRGERRTDILVTYVDGEGKSGASYASLYAEENGIPADSVLGMGDFRKRFERHREKYGAVAALILIDDIAATGSSLADNLKAFLTANADLLVDTKVRIVTLVATREAQSAIGKRIQEFEGLDVEFRTCEIVADEQYAFPNSGQYWRSEEEESRARALCINLGARIYKQSPLGYGNMGLLIVFPTTVPNNSLPILHTYSRAASGQPWVPLFPRVVN